jgi:hypothetical protein
MQYIPPFVIELGMFCYIVYIYMTYFILSSIGGTDDVPLFLADMFVLADQLGSGNGLRCFSGGLRGHICR